MAAKQAFLLLLFNLISAAALDKRFSNLKRCADEECSMLLCRGKAVEDFSGPDCRFLSFKKSETVYVYYKLSGIREDMWAGSVGSSFGYFPKDLLAVNHRYTDKEVEIPAEETDFVCFDTGFDKFDNYNIDSLLGSSPEENGSESKGLSDQVQIPDDTPEETHSSSAQQEPEHGSQAEHDDKPEDHSSSSLHKLVMTTEAPPTKVVESDTAAHLGIKAAEDMEDAAEAAAENVLENSKAKDTPTKSEAASSPEEVKTKEKESQTVSVSEGVRVTELKTTLGNTFDAVTTDEEITKKVTPYEEEESKDVDRHPEGDHVGEEAPLLSFSKESVNTPASDTVDLPETPTAATNEAAEEKTMWTSIGDAVFSAVTGVETTADDVSSEDDEEEEEEEEEEAVANPLSSSEVVVEVKKDGEESLNTESPQVPENLEDAPEPGIVQAIDDKGAVSDSEDESDGEVTEYETDLDEMLEPTDETVETEAHVVTLHPGSQAHISAKPEVEKSDNKIAFQPPTENKDDMVIKDSETSDMTDTQDRSPVANTAERGKHQGSVTVQLNQLGKEQENMADASLPTQTHDALVKDGENMADASLPTQTHDALVKDGENMADASLPTQTHDALVKDGENMADASLPTQTHDALVKDGEKMADVSLPTQTHDALVKDGENMADASLPLVKDGENMADASLPLVKDGENMADVSLPTQTHDALVKDGENMADASLPLVKGGEKIVKEENIVDASSLHHINDSSAKHIEKLEDASLPSRIHETYKTDLEHNNNRQEVDEEPDLHEQVDIAEERKEDDDDTEEEENRKEDKEELLEDENALLLSQSDKASLEAEALDSESAPEPDYSDSVLRLTLLREHFTLEQMHRFQKVLGLKNLLKVEAMFSDLDTELQSARLSHTSTATQDIEDALESILESSENTILDEIEKMLDSQDSRYNQDHQMDTTGLDEEAEILDDFQELAFSLRNKYSTFRDGTALATEEGSDVDQGESEENVNNVPPVPEDDKAADIPENENKSRVSVTSSEYEERPANPEEEQAALDSVQAGADISVEEDGGHFNKNKDNQPGFSEADEMQKVPQATLENPLDLGIGVEGVDSPSGSLDPMEPVPEIHEEDVGASVVSGFLWMCKTKLEEWTVIMISLLPEEWKPGETWCGCPWEAVVTTAVVGVMTFTIFFWRTVLAVKKREYLVDERKLTEQIQALKKEKNDVMDKMSELQKQTEQLKENQKQSKEAASSTLKKMGDLESKVLEAETQNERMVEEKSTYMKLLEEEKATALQNQIRIDKLEKANEKLHLSRKKIQEAFAKTAVLLDEAKIREDARNVHQKSLEKDYTALKEENKTLKAAIKNWEDKHLELSEQIKVYHRSQKDLEDSLVLKDHNVEVLSELLADLDACDLQKTDNKVLANGEVAPDKKTATKNRIKQMMDVSRVQTTLTVVEEERDRFMTKLLNEEKARKALEEQHQELEHSIATLKSDKSHVENQLTILQQKNEIMVEMYQQKENALQQRLTKEELERRSKENLLSEVGGKAVEAEEQVKVLRRRISEMEEQMKKTEEVYKEQIKEQENKTHSNWVNARNAERALNQEKLESSKLREKLAVLTSQLNDRRAPLFRPNSGQPSGPRQGDSYGPSPVSGGAPSPPIMLEGPRRPPSAPVGRRTDPYGPRPPSDPHGRYADNKHISGMDMMGPRSSSPANMDVSTQAVNPQIKAEAQAGASAESPEPGPGSFLASPIRDSPGPMVQGPLPGPHEPLLPPGPHGRLPPAVMYRPPRPGLYHLPPGPHGPPQMIPPPLHGPPLPANGQPGMPLPGPMGGDFGPRPANGHTFLSRPGPGLISDPRGPLPPHFRPPLPSHLGPILPPSGIHGPVGPRQLLPPDMRFPGPHNHTRPPMDVPPGAAAHPADAWGEAPSSALHNSVGGHSGPGQDLHMKQEAPRDSVKPAMSKP